MFVGQRTLNIYVCYFFENNQMMWLVKKKILCKRVLLIPERIYLDLFVYFNKFNCCYKILWNVISGNYSIRLIKYEWENGYTNKRPRYYFHNFPRIRYKFPDHVISKINISKPREKIYWRHARIELFYFRC